MLDTVVWCRQVFIKAAVEIVKRKWIATAYANEVHCLAMKNSRKLKVKRSRDKKWAVCNAVKPLSLGPTKEVHQERAK